MAKNGIIQPKQDARQEGVYLRKQVALLEMRLTAGFPNWRTQPFKGQNTPVRVEEEILLCHEMPQPTISSYFPLSSIATKTLMFGMALQHLLFTLYDSMAYAQTQVT
jgi:hypothetical protein